jgi:trans-aconitate methyltransferase
MVSTFTATDGAAYEQQMGRWSQRLAEPFLDFMGPIGAESILDLGCGTGSLTLALARRSSASRVCGLDVSAAYIVGPEQCRLIRRQLHSRVRGQYPIARMNP